VDPISPIGPAPTDEVDRLMVDAVARMRSSFKIPAFRRGQEHVIRSVLAGRDVLAVMPTGSGKSLSYQLTSQVLPGTTLVVSPLLALIRDQTEKLRALGIPVERIDSSLTGKERTAALGRLADGSTKLALVTPESAVSASFRNALAGAKVSLFAVDEAHCVSQWGHDFRPAYLGLREVAESLGRPRILALTATATPRVREDILAQLGMREPEQVVLSFDRPNLHFQVVTCGSEEDKLRILFRKLLRRLHRPGIIYSATVKSVEDLTFLSKKLRIPAEYYHGRLKKADRDEKQAAFMKAGRRVVMIATNAFGLGVDKPDIRYVLHFHVPGSLEAYVQEAGRAGRDGKPSRCILLWSPDDVAIQEYFQEGNYPTGKQVRQVHEALRAWTDTDRAVGIRALATSSNVGEKRTRVVLDFLEENGWAEEDDDGKWLAADVVPEGMLKLAVKWFDEKRIEDKRRLDALVGYAESKTCRVRYMLDYFGEPGPDRCGRCDNCLEAKKAVAGGRVAAEEEEAGAEAEGGRKKRRRRGRRRGRGRAEAGAAPASSARGAPAAEGDAAAVEVSIERAEPRRAAAQGAPGAGPEGGRRRRRRRGRRRGREGAQGAAEQGASGGAPPRAEAATAGPPAGGATVEVEATRREPAAGGPSPAAAGGATAPAGAATAGAEGGGRRRRRRRGRRGRGRGPAGSGGPSGSGGPAGPGGSPPPPPAEGS
jgi:ATP-dependent DNA helicase RecQ